jgi:hypothetical protein
MMYRLTFDRIGRDSNIDPLDVEADSADEISFAVYNYARPRLRSSELEVVSNLTEGRGSIFCGFQGGGSFTIEAVA